MQSGAYDVRCGWCAESDVGSSAMWLVQRCVLLPLATYAPAPSSALLALRALVVSRASGVRMRGRAWMTGVGVGVSDEVAARDEVAA